MAKLWRVTCIWIFCVSCLFERIQLPTVTAAVVPFDYFEDHEQLSYDLDTEQSKAKYDTRLLSEQLLKEQKSAESSHARPHGGGGSTDGDDADDVEADVDDDLQPHERAASCYNNGHKYTHGQKVPRQDPCEVCLCMDGEIFCWWELCGNKRSNQPTTTYHADSHLSASTAMEGFDGRTSTMQPTSSTQQQFSPNSAAFQHSKKPTKQHTTKSLKMKSYLQQQHQQQQQKLEQQKQLQQKHPHKHAHPHEHSAASLPPLSASSKILNFPENLPSVLYHDYRTEEHQHHQHQHHQQHLKHLKQQQRLLHQQQQLLLQQQQQQQQQRQHMQHVSTAFARATVPPEPPAPPSAGDNENVSDETETDSDILPEPPTKKPKVTVTTTTTTTTTTATSNAKAAAAKATATATTATTTSTATSMPSSQGVLSRLDGRDVQPATQSASASRHGVGVAVDDDSAGGQKSSSESRAELASSASKPAAPQQSAAADSLAISNQPVGQQPASSRSSSEENQDDAFHRWLTSTETNNNSNNSNNAVDDATLDAARTAESQNLNTTTAAAAATNASFQNVGAHSPQQDSDVYFRSSYNDYSSEFNGSVVNIDILLTTADDRQQQQSRQQQQQHKREPLSPAADLIANHSRARTADNSDSSNRAAATQSAVAVAGAAAANTSSLSAQGTSTPSPSRQCNVMGTLYKIGDVLPQDTGNCLQCVCIDGSTSDDTPRITCSPHNCPPLVLPDLFDATGY